MRWAVSASIAETSARRIRDSSSLGTVTYWAMRRRSERLRTSIAEKIANPISARTETITKIISHGDVMTSSIQVVSKVPCGEKSSAGVVYFAVAGARPATFTSDDRLRQGRKQGSVRELVLARELLPDLL